MSLPPARRPRRGAASAPSSGAPAGSAPLSSTRGRTRTCAATCTASASRRTRGAARRGGAARRSTCGARRPLRSSPARRSSRRDWSRPRRVATAARSAQPCAGGCWGCARAWPSRRARCTCCRASRRTLGSIGSTSTRRCSRSAPPRSRSSLGVSLAPPPRTGQLGSPSRCCARSRSAAAIRRAEAAQRRRPWFALAIRPPRRPTRFALPTRGWLLCSTAPPGSSCRSPRQPSGSWGSGGSCSTRCPPLRPCTCLPST
mmetsp:Transcript_24293/g.72009  ORF Transcript_24293/g.72009 Transcript_24293/m.72009 type:complete len:258 (-) Transcript_24293:249-1022(-)